MGTHCQRLRVSANEITWDNISCNKMRVTEQPDNYNSTDILNIKPTYLDTFNGAKLENESILFKKKFEIK